MLGGGGILGEPARPEWSGGFGVESWRPELFESFLAEMKPSSLAAPDYFLPPKPTS